MCIRDSIYDWCDPFLTVCDEIEGLITDNRIFKQRNVDIGAVSYTHLDVYKRQIHWSCEGYY